MKCLGLINRILFRLGCKKGFGSKSEGYIDCWYCRLKEVKHGR